MNEKNKSSLGTVTIFIKASESTFIVILYKVVLVFSSVAFNSTVAVNFKGTVAIQVKATEKYFPTVYYAVQGGSNF